MLAAPVRIATCLLAAGLLGACTSSKPTRFVTVTAGPSTPPAAIGSSAPSASSPAVSSATPTPTTTQSKISGTCDTLLPDADVYDALGVSSLPGTLAFVIGKPEPDIGRVAYLNCRYGVTGRGTQATPAIEIGVSLYTTADKAAARITETVDDYTAHGGSTSQIAVKDLPATLITGGIGDGYAIPLLVVQSGQRTIAVSVASSVATGAKAQADAIALATLALTRTAR